MFVICSSIASVGAYTPIFFMSLQGSREGYDVQDLVLLQTFLGLAIAFGVVTSGSIIDRNFSISYRKFNVSRQFVCQVPHLHHIHVYINACITYVARFARLTFMLVIIYGFKCFFSFFQVNIVLVAISTLIISGVAGYRNLCLLGWSYGLGLGGYRYALKMLALERIRPKYFTKAWGKKPKSVLIL